MMIDIRRDAAIHHLYKKWLIADIKNTDENNALHEWLYIKIQNKEKIMIRNTHLTGSPTDVVEYMQNQHKQHKMQNGEKRATGYYSLGGASSEWFGKGAAEQGLVGAVVGADLERALAGTVNHTREDLSTRGGQSAETRRLGEELTIAAPKSVSLLSVDDRRIVEAHQAAVREAMAYVQDEMLYARHGQGGKDGSEFTKNITAALFVHEDARDAEGNVAPHLHSHAIVSNMTRREDGKRVNIKLDWGHENEKKMTVDAVYKAALAKNIKSLGYGIEQTKDGFEIQGISREQIEAFSPRSQQIKQEIGGERGESSAKARESAQNRTKGRKTTLNQTNQRYAWRQQMRAAGVDTRSLRSKADQRLADPGSKTISAKAALKSAIRHLSERDSVFSEQQLKADALAAALGDVSYADIQAAIKQKAGGLLTAGVSKRGETTRKQQMYSTQAAVFREAEILHRTRDGQGKAAPIIHESDHQAVVQEVSFTPKELDDENRERAARTAGNDARNEATVESLAEVKPLTKSRLRSMFERALDADDQRKDSDFLQDHAGNRGSGTIDLRRSVPGVEVAALITEREAKQGFAFSNGQKAAVNLALTAADRHVGIVGAAGAGKTTAMATIVEQYKRAGYEVIGVAPSAAAAHELNSAGCDDTRTLASSLLKHDKDGETPKKRLYVMDEAGMVSASDMDRFLHKADAEGARTIMVGDPRQLAAVDAGSPFGQMLKTGSVQYANIDDIQRQKDPQLRAIAQAFAGGDPACGVALAKPYMQTVKTDPGNRVETLAKAAAAAYLALDQSERDKTLLLASTNATRRAANDQIRQGMIQEGSLGDRAVMVTALDKMGLTKEASARPDHYISTDGRPVVVEFGRGLKASDEVLAKKGSQWNVKGTQNGLLQLESRDDGTVIDIRPKVGQLQAFSAREIELRTGDQILFRQNNKALEVTNGMTGTVKIDDYGKISVQTATGSRIALDTSRAQVFDYAYARTVHSSQGATVERAIVVGEAGRVSTAESAYVACSREKTCLQIITDDPEKLSKSWQKYGEKQNALGNVDDAQLPENLNEIQKQRDKATRELGLAGDLAAEIAKEADVNEDGDNGCAQITTLEIMR